jgi:hypothetical protein
MFEGVGMHWALMGEEKMARKSEESINFRIDILV